MEKERRASRQARDIEPKITLHSGRAGNHLLQPVAQRLADARHLVVIPQAHPELAEAPKQRASRGAIARLAGMDCRLAYR